MAGEMSWYPRGGRPERDVTSHPIPRTRQPDWQFIANLGDRNPLEYGGYFIYQDATGVYPEEGEALLINDPDEPENGYIVYRFLLDRLKLVDGWLVPINYDSSWPHPVDRYDAWFHEELDSVARTAAVDTDLAELELAFTSADPLVRARAYEAIGSYYGLHELDPDPIVFDRQEVEERYRSELIHR